MDKNLKKNFIIGTIVWIIYGLAVLGITLLLSETIWYSGLVNYNNFTHNMVMIIIGAMMLIPGYMGYISKVLKGKFLNKEGLV